MENGRNIGRKIEGLLSSAASPSLSLQTRLNYWEMAQTLNIKYQAGLTLPFPPSEAPSILPESFEDKYNKAQNNPNSMTREQDDLELDIRTALEMFGIKRF